MEAQARIDRAHAERVREIVTLEAARVAVERTFLSELRAIKRDLAEANIQMLRETA